MYEYRASAMLCSETLVGVALMGSIFLPCNFDITFRMSAETTIGVPLRWIVPLLLISGAGIFSIAALFVLFSTLAHHAGISRYQLGISEFSPDEIFLQNHLLNY